MFNCAVKGCKNRGGIYRGKKVRYFRFPKNPQVSTEWLKVCRKAVYSNSMRICSDHFLPSCFIKSLQQQLLKYSPTRRRRLKDDAVPTENLSSDVTVAVYNTVSTSCVDETMKIPAEVTHEDISVQMNDDSSIMVGDVASEIKNLQQQLKRAEARVSTLTTKNLALERKHKRCMKKYRLRVKEMVRVELHNILGTIFTPGQIKMLLNKRMKKVQKWSSVDVAAAISLRSVSPKAYRYLRNKLHIPLPGLSTLRKWAMIFNLEPGPLNDVITLMKYKGRELTQIDKLTVLSFDEVYVSQKVSIDRKAERVVGPHKACQVVMARGLHTSWKQPVYYQFDNAMTNNILFDIISKLQEAGFTVVAIVSDMGTSNMALWKILNIGIGPMQQSFFQHPTLEEAKIFTFADAPHLLKLARNHFLDQGFIIDGTLISKSCIEKILNMSTADLKVAFKLTRYHLDVRGSERQRVRPAAQLFSNSVSAAIEWFGLHNLLKDEPWIQASYIIKMINDWFDVVNSSTKYGSHPGAHAYGVNLESQNTVLENMSQLMQRIIIPKHKSLIPFQKGIILTNSSLKQILPYLQSRYNTNSFSFQYILTSRLNQDVLENFFSYIRGMGATNDHPSPLDFKYRLRWYVLGKHSADVFTVKKNTEASPNEQCLLTLNCALQSEVEINQETNSFRESLVEVTKYTDEELIAYHTQPIRFDIVDELCEGHVPLADLSMYNPSAAEERFLEELEISDKISNEGLKYIAGYVAHRYRTKFNHLGCPTQAMSLATALPEWVVHISRGNCMYPSSDLMSVAQVMDKVFCQFHGSKLSKVRGIFKSVAQLVKDSMGNNFPQNIADEVLLCLIRTRTYIRLREINRKIQSDNYKKKQKKMFKITNTKL